MAKRQSRQATGAAATRARELAGKASSQGSASSEETLPVSSRAAGLQVAEIQRSRLIAAAIRAVGEVGYTATTVAQITGRARVSRRTFYELFPNQEACLAAAVEYVLVVIEDELATLQLEGLPWREQIRSGLAAVLAFLDREPVLARICVVQSTRGGPDVLARREQALVRLAAIVDEGRLESTRVSSCTALTAEGIVGAALTIVQARLAGTDARPLSPLLNELMSMIVLPYLGSSAARRELTRPAPSFPAGAQPSAAPVARTSDPLDGVPMRLTYRTMKVLESVAENPGASNREIAEHAGIHDQGQVSKLLARLERLGLLSNRHDGHLKGEPNAWTLARTGELVVQSIHTNLTCRPAALQRSGTVQRRGRTAVGRTAASHAAATQTGRGFSSLDLQVNGTGESH